MSSKAPNTATPPVAGEIVSLTAGELSRAIHDGKVSCREVMAAYLDHIDAVNPHVNAIVSLRERSGLMAEAANHDDELARGEYRGWLHGMPQAVKDLSPVAGMRTTMGSPLLADNVPARDAIIVERMKRDGAIIIGKTNTPEFGLGSQTYNPVFGATRNAYDQTKTAGGSSGGAAVALATRMLPVADGSDMMGSLRNPAAYNNVIGFRPSMGRVPHWPGANVFSQQLGTERPMGRNVADVARMLDTMAGPDARLPLSLDDGRGEFSTRLDRNCHGMRIGWLGDWDGYLPMEHGVLPQCEQALADLTAMGCVVEPALPDFSPEHLWDAWLVLRQCELAGNLSPPYQDPDKRKQLKPEAQWEIDNGLKRSAADVFSACVTRSNWHHAMCRLFADYDFLVLPSAQVWPFDVDTHWPEAVNGVEMDTYHRWMEVVVAATMSGRPVASVPAGFATNGLPMGLQIIGPQQDDLAVLQISHAYEQSCGWTADAHAPALAQPNASDAQRSPDG